jgi:carbonic anhydrase
MNKFLKLIGVGCFVGLMLVACSKQDASPEIDDAKIAAAKKAESLKNPEELAFDMLKEIHMDNIHFIKKHKPDYFKAFRDAQHPRTTLLGCADSRFHTHALDKSPDNDIFMVRDIGNQILNAPGSIEYGVRHLHTPLLLIVGHTGCGAIAAATKGYDDLEPAIKKELDNLKLSIRKKDPTEEELRANVEENVHFQVAEGLKEYKDLVSKKELMVVGAVYDVRGEYGRGAGKIYFTNVNGEKDQKVLDEFIQRIKKHPSPVSN